MDKFIFFADNIPQIVWTSETDGNLDYFNRKWYEYTGLSYEKSKDLGIHDIIHPDEQKKTIELWSRSFKEGYNFEMEYRLRGVDGNYRWFLGRGLPMKDDSGNIVKWFGTCTEIHELKELQEKLKIQNKELAITNNDLDNFIYTASHDLKTPISNIEGLINSLPELVLKDVNSDELNLFLDLIHQSIDKFKNTVENLTEISKVQRNIEESNSEVYLCEVIEEVKDTLKAEIQRSNARIQYDFSDCPVIHFSYKNLRSILFNLINNSLKYRSASRDPVVHIRTVKSDEYIILLIFDNGIGIDREKIKLLFGMFKRLHDHVEGAGIGLYIVKRIVENYGGKIEVESEVDKGTTFRIFFKVK